jgi:hypothetical protein
VSLESLCACISGVCVGCASVGCACECVSAGVCVECVRRVSVGSV